MIPYAVTSWIDRNLLKDQKIHKNLIRKQVLHRRWIKKIKEDEMKKAKATLLSWDYISPEPAITKYYMSIAEYERSVRVYMYFMLRDDTRREFKWKEEKKVEKKLKELLPNNLNSHWSERSTYLLKYNLHTGKLDIDPIRFLFFINKKHVKESDS